MNEDVIHVFVMVRVTHDRELMCSVICVTEHEENLQGLMEVLRGRLTADITYPSSGHVLLPTPSCVAPKLGHLL